VLALFATGGVWREVNGRWIQRSLVGTCRRGNPSALKRQAGARQAERLGAGGPNLAWGKNRPGG
jgi:hypothetical protein